MIEKNFDTAFVAALALREKQIQQNYRPIIAVHKWFARRPGTLFRSLLLSEFGQEPLCDTYFKSNNLAGIRVADPFMGGGTPLFEANRLGCDVTGFDINPMAYWIVRQEIEWLDLGAYRKAASLLQKDLEQKIGSFYRTRCIRCNSLEARVKYFLWVKTKPCDFCGKTIDLFSGYLIAENKRHPQNVLICSVCGALNETDSVENAGHCHSCGARLVRIGPARKNHCTCPHCNVTNTYPHAKSGPPQHRMFAIEYHCSTCKAQHVGRFFKKPDADDLRRYAAAEQMRDGLEHRFVPGDTIPRGDETDRLHRWGYHHYSELFNARQLLGLELSCNLIMQQQDERVRNALATNLSDLLRYQNMLCRYDTMALKSLDIFSVHGFPVGLIQCESNLLGISAGDKGANIGSGGWTNIVEKYARAKEYCAYPFEVREEHKRKTIVSMPGEWIGDRRDKDDGFRNVALHCQSATLAEMAPATLDAVVTDPPYYGNVQYAELMDFCYVWLRQLVGATTPAFQAVSTRNADELTGNVTMGRGLDHFAQGLAEVYSRMARALKPGAPLSFTYHHNSLDAYYPVAISLLDAGLTCTASIPCPAEMGGSIHINGTGSSIVDTIFVCRSTGKMPRRWIAESPQDIADLVRDDVNALRRGSVTPTVGDIRCIIFGHLIRLTIWMLRQSWDQARPTKDKLLMVAKQVQCLGGLTAIERCLGRDILDAPKGQHMMVQESTSRYGAEIDDITF